MKRALIAFLLILGQSAFSMEETLDFNDNFQTKKIVLMEEVLIKDLSKLHSDFTGERDVAGKFEIHKNKIKKSSYLNQLRSKLERSHGPTRL